MAFKEATSLKALKESKKLRIVLEDTPILITYCDDSVYAINDQCPHMKASLMKGDFKDGIVTCAKHNAQIDVKTGEILEKAKVLFIKMPTKTAKTYETKVEADKVYVNL